MILDSDSGAESDSGLGDFKLGVFKLRLQPVKPLVLSGSCQWILLVVRESRSAHWQLTGFKFSSESGFSGGDSLGLRLPVPGRVTGRT